MLRVQQNLLDCCQTFFNFCKCNFTSKGSSDPRSSFLSHTLFLPLRFFFVSCPLGSESLRRAPHRVIVGRRSRVSVEIKGACQRSKPSLRILWRGRRRDSSEKFSTWSTHSGTAEYGHMGDRVSPVRVTHTKRNGASVGPFSVVHPLARDA